MALLTALLGAGFQYFARGNAISKSRRRMVYGVKQTPRAIRVPMINRILATGYANCVAAPGLDYLLVP